MSLAIETRQLVKNFGSFRAVKGISLEVREGEIFGFIGPNGSGKSTTIRMLCGILSPSSGDGRVLGFDIRKEAEEIRQNIGYMSQKFSLYEELKVTENFYFYGGIYGLNRGRIARRREELFALLGLEGTGKILVKELPTGWKQRLALACALVHQPRLLFLDEPTSGVDPLSRRDFWELLYRLAEEGVTVFITTHYMDEATHCRHLSFIHEGEIIADGSPAELQQELSRKTGIQEPGLEEVFAQLTTASGHPLRGSDRRG